MKAIHLHPENDFNQKKTDFKINFLRQIMENSLFFAGSEILNCFFVSVVRGNNLTSNDFEKLLMIYELYGTIE